MKNRRIAGWLACIFAVWMMRPAVASDVGQKVKLTDGSWWDNRKFTDAERAGTFVVVYLQKFNGDFDYNYKGHDSFIEDRLSSSFKDDCLNIICVWGNQNERLGGGWRTVPPKGFTPNSPKNIYVTLSSNFFSKFKINPNTMETYTYVIVVAPDDTVLWRGTGDEFSVGILEGFVKQMTNPYLTDSRRVDRLKAVDSGINRFLNHTELCKRLDKLVKNKATQLDATAILSQMEKDIREKTSIADAHREKGETFSAWLALDSVIEEFDGHPMLKDYRTIKRDLEKDEQVKVGRRALKDWSAIAETVAALRSERSNDGRRLTSAIGEIEKFRAKYPKSPFEKDIESALYALNVLNGTVEGIVTDNKHIEPLNGILVTSDGTLYDARKLATKRYILVYFSASWCPPCRAFTPTLVDLYKTAGGGGNWEVILMSSDSTPANMLDYMTKYNMAWPAVQHDKIAGVSLNEYRARGIPHLVMLNEKGELVSDSDHIIFEKIRAEMK